MSDKTTAGEAPVKKKRKGLVIALVATLLVAGGGGAAAWVLMKPDPEVEGAGQVKQAAPKQTVFVPLEQFTVNLADDDGERMAQVAMTLELVDTKAETATKARMPAVRNEILLLLSASESKDVLTVSGKQKLAAQVVELASRHLGWTTENGLPNPVLAVHFSHFIVQ